MATFAATTLTGMLASHHCPTTVDETALARTAWLVAQSMMANMPEPALAELADSERAYANLMNDNPDHESI